MEILAEIWSDVFAFGSTEFLFASGSTLCKIKGKKSKKVSTVE